MASDNLKNYEVTPHKPDEPKPTKKDELLAEIDVVKLQKELEAQKLGFKSFAEFVEKQKELSLKEAELIKREETVVTQEQIIAKREEEVVRAAEINKNVKDNLVAKEIQDYKKASKLREYAFQTYYQSLDVLFAKIINAKAGASCLGIVKRKIEINGRSVEKQYDETVVIDQDWREELLPIISSIQTALKVAPKYNQDGEYLTLDEQPLEDEEETEETNEPDV